MRPESLAEKAWYSLGLTTALLCVFSAGVGIATHPWLSVLAAGLGSATASVVAFRSRRENR
jgi:hypothetical protein